MRNSSKMALGGMSAALSLALMLLTYLIPVLTYTSPAFAGAVLLVMVLEGDRRWAWITFVAVSLLSLLMLADKEAAVLYLIFFGYYPILLPTLETRIHNTVARWIVKFIVFNAAIVATYFILIKLLGMPIDEMETFGKWIVWVMLAGANVIFVLYDLLLRKLILAYTRSWRKKIDKLFRKR